MENDLYALSLIALIAGATLLLVSGIFLGMLIPAVTRWNAERQVRQAKSKWQAFKQRLPVVTLKKREAAWRCGITSLMPQIECDVFNEYGDCVGRLCYVLSPIAECVYLYEIEIFKGFRGKLGYGTAAVLELSRVNNSLPIIPDQEMGTEDALKFWKKLHKLATHNQGCPVKGTISNSAWAAERQKWAQLDFHEKLFDHLKSHHEKVFLGFQIENFPTATGIWGIQDPEFLEGFQPNR